MSCNGLAKSTRDREHDKFDVDENGCTIVRTSAKGEFKLTGLENGAITEIDLTTTWVKAERSGASNPVGTGPLESRQSVSIKNTSGNDNIVLYNYIGSGDIGWPIEDSGFKSVLFKGGSKDIYLRMLAGTGKVILDEMA